MTACRRAPHIDGDTVHHIQLVVARRNKAIYAWWTACKLPLAVHVVGGDGWHIGEVVEAPVNCFDCIAEIP